VEIANLSQWAMVDPITYLVGIAAIIGSYLFFLYNNREVSYRSILRLSISNRQMKLYKQRGFNLERWKELVNDGKALRREIKMISEEYDVKWDDRDDQTDNEMAAEVLEVLEEEDDREGKNEGR
jgi:calcium uniporter protein, mitochondrial